VSLAPLTLSIFILYIEQRSTLDAIHWRHGLRRISIVEVLDDDDAWVREIVAWWNRCIIFRTRFVTR